MRDMNSLPWKQWHSEKNPELDPREIAAGSSKNVWWLCEMGHEWQARVASRVRGARCPICINQRVLEGFNDLITTHPEVSKKWVVEKNLPLTPRGVVAGSNKKVWWRCDQGHEFEMSVWDRAGRNRGCKYCTANTVLKGFNDFQSLHPELAQKWDFQKNFPITPDQVQPMSDKKVWFLCESGHGWKTEIKNVTKGHGCPSCAGNVLVPGENDLETVFPELARQWSPRNPLKPSEVASVSGLKAWWVCDLGHEWETRVANRKTSGCPVCSNRKLEIGVNDLQTSYPVIASEWHVEKNGGILPHEILSGKRRAYWWICQEGHEWQASMHGRQKTGCPKCAKYGFSQSEDALLYFIENHQLKAWKIGITNSNREYDRISRFQKDGWRLVFSIETKGWVALNSETELFKWIRKELSLPQYLDSSTMGSNGGASETFAIVDELKAEIVEKMKHTVSKFELDQ